MPKREAVALRLEVVLRRRTGWSCRRRAVDSDLRAAKDAEAIFEADDGAAVEPEQVADQVAEIAVAERAAKAMRDAKRALVARHAQRRGQRREREVGLREVDVAIGIVFLRRRRAAACGWRRVAAGRFAPARVRRAPASR